MRAALVIAGVAAAAVPAHADEAAPRYTASLGLPGLAYRGVAVEVERDLAGTRHSVAGGLQLRSTAQGDYGSTTVGAGVEGRWWILRRAIWTRRARGAAIGPYLGLRLDLSSTSLRDDGGDSLGAARTLSSSLLFGYRFAPWRGLEVRPYLGLARRREWQADRSLPAWSRGGLVLGLAAGWSW